MDTLRNVAKKSNKKYIYAVILLIVVASVGYALYYVQTTLSSRNKDVDNLNSKVEQLSKDKKDLSSKNENLKEVVKTFQNQKGSGSTSSSDTQTQDDKNSVKPVAKLVVRFVKDQPGSDFTISGKPLIKDDLRVVYITFTNLTDSPQTYDHFQFEATLNTGAVVQPRVYAPYESTNWLSSKLDAGASQDVTLLFGTNENLTTLSWTPNGATKPLIVTVPSQQ
jgi:hypothetical protein